jgi:hypothetical protein
MLKSSGITAQNIHETNIKLGHKKLKEQTANTKLGCALKNIH